MILATFSGVSEVNRQTKKVQIGMFFSQILESLIASVTPATQLIDFGSRCQIITAITLKFFFGRHYYSIFI